MTQYIAVWASGVRVHWRALNWGEYRQFKKKLSTSPMGVFADIYRAVVLDGPPLEKCPAGIADFIAKHCLEDSPFSGEYQPIVVALKKGRDTLASSYLVSAKAMVSHLFHYTFEEIDKWDADTFFLRLAQAEFIAGKGIDPGDPDAKVTSEKRQTRPMSRAQSMVQDRVKEKSRSR